tara:strand:+ start:12782 stop:13765 length:984 start_codon:yes stop_codon:yes gene_type:complete
MSLSVIIPAYNVEQYLEECVVSVLEQDANNLEIIIVDDGSTDGTLDIANKITNKDDRVKVFSFDNAGLSVARNRGVKEATKDYVLFLDSDDKLANGQLVNVLKYLENEKLDCLFFESTIFYDDNTDLSFYLDYSRPQSILKKIESGENIFTEMMKVNSYNVSACMYILSRNLLDDIKFLPGIYHEDSLFTTQVLLSNKSKRVACIDNRLYLRRIRQGSIMTINKTRKHVEGYEKVYDELLKIDTSCLKTEASKYLKRFRFDLLATRLITLAQSKHLYSFYGLSQRYNCFFQFLKNDLKGVKLKTFIMLVIPELYLLKIIMKNKRNRR